MHAAALAALAALARHREETVQRRGCQHVSIRYAQRLVEAGVDRSVGSVGDSYDNALAEPVIGLFRTEVIHQRGPWRGEETVEFAMLEWVDWLDNRRLLEPIGNVPPVGRERVRERACHVARRAALEVGDTDVAAACAALNPAGQGDLQSPHTPQLRTEQPVSVVNQLVVR